MDAKQAAAATTQNGKTAERLRKAVQYIEKKILKAIKRGQWKIKIDKLPFFGVGNPLVPVVREEEAHLLAAYFEELGFSVIHEYCWLHISWRPSNFDQIFTPCPADSRLKHLVLAGQEPKVVVGDGDDNS